MKLLITAALVGSVISVASARDDVNSFSVEKAMSVSKVKSAIGGGVDFYFGNQKHPKVLKNLGSASTNQKTNAFGKSDEEACQWAFASAMKSLRNRALSDGGNAVINIKSNYKHNLTSSDTTFDCGAGTFIAGVALTGDIVKIKK